MQHLEVSGAVRHIYIYIYVIRRLKVKKALTVHASFVSVNIPTVNVAVICALGGGSVNLANCRGSTKLAKDSEGSATPESLRNVPVDHRNPKYYRLFSAALHYICNTLRSNSCRSRLWLQITTQPTI